MNSFLTMNIRLLEWICRLGCGLGIAVAAVSAVRISYIYKVLRGYGMHATSVGNTEAYSIALGALPETVDLHLLLIFAGVGLILLFGSLWKAVRRRAVET
ncbi:hypothetical protein [Arenimonas composti]|uniref:Uncharacterized protein n=1 Tax=Arenimonas composti TR7-09 = DSM 18010 TaxID=1121013 RepID=A0A091BFS3_9GAMM|nr:hypothetical protein [Arenimonas composti]KFN50586.1 hypothetical protein P873_05345 [Arenimonas composti TR7-09 = DSM 18010]